MHPFESGVREFHTAQRLGINREFNVGDELLRRHLILEELSELTLAWYRKDSEGVLDACGDLAYVIVGTAVQFGYPMQEPGRQHTIHPNTRWDDHRSMRLLHMQMMTLMKGELDSWVVVCLLEALFRFCDTEVIDLVTVFGRVHRANMTKTPRGAETDERVSNKGPTFVPPSFKDMGWIHG